MEIDIVAIIAAITGLITGIAGFWKARQARVDAETARLTANAAAEKAHVNGLVETVHAITEENARLRKCIEDLEADLKGIHAERDAYRQRLETLEAARVRERVKMEQLQADIKALHAEREQYQAEIRSLRAENAHWKERVRLLEQELDRLRLKFDPPEGEAGPIKN